VVAERTLRAERTQRVAGIQAAVDAADQRVELARDRRGQRGRGPRTAGADARRSRPAASAAREPQAESGGARRKLAYKEQRELESLPALIESLETELSALHAAMATPDYFRQPGTALARDQSRLRDLESRLTAAFGRWETLEAGGA
jgi:ATP-binding cassette subfamily F protein uup